MNLKNYFKKAREEKWAIGQFNFSTLEQMRAILGAAQKLRSPVILGASEGESKFFGLEEIVALVELAKAKMGPVPIFLNLDHAKDLNLIKKAIDYGFSAVHFDGSELPLEKNIEYAKKAVSYAHKKNVLVEGELDPIEEKSLTSLAQAEKFIKETKVDSLAVAIGSIHSQAARLNFDKLKEINKKIDAFLVLHGGSGVSDEEVKKAIELGIVKININTALRTVWKESLIEALKSEEIKPYKILTDVQEKIQRKVEEKINLFGSYGK